MPIDLFLSDVTSSVKMSKLPNGHFLAEGLPILQPGTWNDKNYTAEDMQGAVAAFAEIQAQDKWEPPLRPYHAYDREGKPLHHSASETMGWHKALRYDETDERLKADVEIVDAQAAADIIAGKLRFTSTEVARNCYTSPLSGKTYDLAIVGTAFVDNPAVKGMPWEIVVNAAEFGHAPGSVETFASWYGYSADAIRDMVAKEFLPANGGDAPSGWVREVFEDHAICEKDGEHWRVPFKFDKQGQITVGEGKKVKQAWVDTQAATTGLSDAQPAGLPGTTAGMPGKEGVSSMGLIEVLKAKLSALGAKAEDLAEFDQFAATEPEAKPAPPPPPAAPPAVAELDPATKAQLEQLSKANAELTGRVETMAAEARRTKAGALVDGWVSGGKLPPALRVTTFALVDALSAVTLPEVDVLAQDAEGKQTTRKAGMLDLLGEIVTGIAPAIATKPQGAVWQGSEDTEAPRKMTDAEIEAMAATVGGK